VSLTRVWGMLGGANHGPTCSKAVSPQNQAEYLQQVYTPEERAKMGRYGAKAARPRLLNTSTCFKWQADM